MKCGALCVYARFRFDALHNSCELCRIQRNRQVNAVDHLIEWESRLIRRIL